MVRDYIYVDNLWPVIARLITARAAGLVNVGNVGHSALDVVRTVEQIVTRPVGLEFAPARAVDAPASFSTCRAQLRSTRLPYAHLPTASAFSPWTLDL